MHASRLFPALPMLLLLAARPALAQPSPPTQKNYDDCASTDDDVSIKGCTIVIASGQDKGGDLAIDYANRGQSYENKGRHDQAIADFTRSLALKPQPEIYNERGRAYDAELKFDLAIADFTTALAIKPSQGSYYERGYAFYNKGKDDEAIADLTRAIAIKPDADSYLQRGLAYLRKKQLDETIADLTRAIALRPGASYYYQVRGEANEDKGLHAQAIADYTAMIKLDPKSAFALGRRGLSYERLGQMPQAAADYREALKLSPDLKDAADGLARVETAMAAPAKPAAPDAAAIIAEGLADAQKRDFAAANDAFLKALALKPDAPQILFDLGLAEAQMPSYELRAIAWFKLYLMHAPDAANAAAVHTQLAAMEIAYEDKLGTIADGLEQVFKQRQAQHPLSSYQPSTAESLKSIATSVGWELAEIRFAIGDSSGAVASLKRNNGAGWQAEWSKYWQAYAAQKPIAVGSVEHLPEAVAAGGGLDQAYDMLHQAYNAGAVAFFLEQGDKARAQKLAGGEIAARQMTGCPADAAQDQADGDFAERCRAGRWWSTGREAYLLSIAKNGVMLDTDYQENRLPDYLKSEELDTNDLQFAFQLYPDAAATRIANLALEYRKVRGPARDR